MSQRIIHQADLRTIETNLSTLNHSIEHVYHYVMELQKRVQNTDQKLEKLSNDFYNYLQEKLKMEQLQLAETRLIRVRQKVEKEFGHYDAIRRQATGILQAIETGVVRDEIIRNSTEEFMLGAPKYWLAPCLVALSAWISDKKELAERALQEALRRNKVKTSLFFALITRRTERIEASMQWLEYYFQLQDPFALEREVIILIDAFTNGVLVPGARKRCEQQMVRWMNDIRQMGGPNYLSDWTEVFQQFIPQSQQSDYPYLEKYSPTWKQLDQSLSEAKSHKWIHEFFVQIFTGDLQAGHKISDAVDQILHRLVTGFDEEELAVREEDRRLSLIIDADGDREKAEEKFKHEQTAWHQRFHFKDVLKTLVFSPQAIEATKASQRFAVAFCKDWIKQAYQDYTAQNRKHFPTEVSLSIHGWKGKTRDGSNQNELLHDLFNYLENHATKNKKYAKLGKRHLLGLVIGGLLSIVGLVLSFFFSIGYLLLLIGLIGPAWFVFAFLRSKRTYHQYLKQVKEEAKNHLLACLAEVVDWRREYEQEEKRHQEVLEYLSGIQKEQYVQATFDHARIL